MKDPRGIIYKFTPAELQIADMVALLRHETCNNKKPEQLRLDYIGFLGEMYIAKLLNVYPDLTTHRRSVVNGSDFGDLVVKNKRIDVKTTERTDGTIMVKEKSKNTNIDYYLHLIADPPYITYIGGISSKVLCQPKNIKVFGFGPVYTVFNDKLPTDITKW